MKAIWEWLRLHLVTTIVSTGVLSGLGGALISDFSEWRAANRDFLKAQAEASQKADQELFTILRKFSDKAIGKASTSEDDLNQLRAKIMASYLVAEALSSRLPDIKNDFDNYANALILLKKSAENFSGPRDAKAFVEAVSLYGDRRKIFESRLASLQRSWPL